MKPYVSAVFLVKFIHSLIWVIMASATFYILYSGISGHVNRITYLSLILIGLEIAVLLANRWTCPLTHVAQKVKPDWQDGDDIFLPPWLAIHNKLIFGSLLALGVSLLVVRLLT